VEWLVGGTVLLLFVMAVAAFGVFPTLAVIVVGGLMRILFLVGTGCDT
jgi:nitrate reductase NapE component